MGWHWKTSWFCVWLLSQTLGFALPALPSVVGEEVPPCLVWEQSQGGNHGYDDGFQPGLGYDAESPPATTQGLNDPVGTVPTTLAYDTCPISTIQVTGDPRASPVAEVGFDAAKTAGAVEQGSMAVLKNGYYEVNGLKFSEYYYNKLWSTGRGAPSLVANDILASGARGVPDAVKAGFFRYEANGWEMVFNPTTKEVWHLQPIK